MNQEVKQFLAENLKIKIDLETVLEKPKLPEHGDIAFPCFLLSKELRKNPVQIALDLEKELQHKLPSSITKIDAIGPYLNFHLNPDNEVKDLFNEFYSKNLFKPKIIKKEKILIEWPSPNTNKALHIGHSRNMLLGNAIYLILQRSGHTVIKTNLNNDRGIAVCKAMLSYKLFGNHSTPSDLGLRGDLFVSHWYSLYNEKNKDVSLELDKKAQEMLVLWENGDSEVRKLWSKMLSWVYEGYNETYSNYKLPKFDKEYRESEIYDKGKSIVLNALENNVKGFARERDGAVYVDLEAEGYGKKYLLRGDGTTLYMTQDLYLSNLKTKDFNADKYIFVVGKEQEYHFNVLFELLDRLNQKQNNIHLSYGYVYDKNGKKFSSRLGNTIGADEVYNQIVEKAKNNLIERSPSMPKKVLDSKSKAIGFSALAFAFLKHNPLHDINFDPDKALEFEGETGPYLQYTYARIKSLLKKGEYSNLTFDKKETKFDSSEIHLVKELKEYSNILTEVSTKLKISFLAHYLLKVAKLYNEIYQNKKILTLDDNISKTSLLTLSFMVSEILKDGLSLLSIEVVEEM